ncbi:unnamed protein product (macronuclear) [Paramecium tetraurelia]|uniref:MSP domain-containing protein n=1 Tax=Paramecium tetraurelia TaxID=5888 RepID=A0EAH1_PARTE|nr:uncharacterized protein GSPATT00025020001 [Paramecium tetraurelia]CAK92288.1 unnamed protein product [Paramecium tetraurelia]|eukprot:XP_001459685.1 hypothetical protein (macronuclear) [Paramecium tetraurelia strain d4-2]
MSNIKFVYSKKVHKIPQKNATNLQSVIETIKSIYNQLNTVYLYAIINPDETDLVAEIRTDTEFCQLKTLYIRNQWPSIKLLVTETQDYKSILKDSWGLLNQSMAIVEKQSRDACTLSQPIQIDQSQQIAPSSGHQGTQVQVHQQDNAQNTNQVDFRQNLQLKQFIADIVDKRIRDLGLINKDQEYNFTLTSKIPLLIGINGKKMTTQITMQNSGKSQWLNAALTNAELGIHYQINNVSCGECISVTIDLPYIPEHFEDEKERVYKFYIICENKKYQMQKLSDPISIRVQASDIDHIVKQLQDLFPQKKREDLIKYINEKGINKEFDQYVDMLLQEY